MTPKLVVVTGEDPGGMAQGLGFVFREQTGNHAVKGNKVPRIIEDLKVTIEAFSNLP